MADASLDEIIKQKRMQRFKLNNNTPGNRVNQKQGMIKKKGGKLFKDVQKDLGIKTKKNLSINTDARNRIIQKQRIKFTDARDRLAQIAKQGDARDKLNQIRKGKPGDKVIPQQKKTVVKKKILNVPRQTLNVGQTRMKGAAVIRTVAGAKRKIKGRPGVVRRADVITKGNRPGGRVQALSNNPGVITIKNNNARPYNTYEVVNYRPEVQLAPRGQSFAGGMGVPSPMDTMLTVGPETIIRTRPTEQVVYAREYEPEVRPSRLRITAANSDYRYADQWQGSAMQGRKREYYDDAVEYQVYPKKIATVQAPVVQAESGTKVVVSNLHPCVSVEDMEELLGTVGSVFNVRMVRQGVAEAFFVNQEDAYRSVELFNNRQLDGQPMKVMVVRKKAQVVTSARSVLRNARGRTSYYVQ